MSPDPPGKREEIYSSCEFPCFVAGNGADVDGFLILFGSSNGAILGLYFKHEEETEICDDAPSQNVN